MHKITTKILIAAIMLYAPLASAQTIFYTVGSSAFSTESGAVDQSKQLFSDFSVNEPVVKHSQQAEGGFLLKGAAPQFTAAAPTSLFGSGINSTQTTIQLNALTTPSGSYALKTLDLVGGVGNMFYATIEPATINKETVGCTAVTQNSNGSATMTGCSRGLSFYYPYQASTSLAESHAGGSTVVLSDSPQLYNDIITYVNNATVAGAVDAAPGVKGIVDVATAAQAAGGVLNGSGNTDAYLALTSNIASSTRTANKAQVVISSSTTGFIDSSYLGGLATTTAFLNGIPFTSIGKSIFLATTTESFIPPSGVSVVYAQCVGGGGAGGGTGAGADSVGGGGGGGAFVAQAVSLTGLSTVPITIGAGGIGVSAGAGGAGGNTTFGSVITANGGSGGSSGSGAATLTIGGGNGGTASYTATASTSVFSVSGTAGGYGFVTIPTAGVFGKQGDGGGTFWHGSIPGITITSGNNFMGTTTQAFGVGGAGSISVASALTQYGSPGSPGACLVTW